MFKYKHRSKSNKSYPKNPKNKNAKLKKTKKEVNLKVNNSKELIGKTNTKTINSNISNSNSNNSSLSKNKSFKKKEKEKTEQKNKNPEKKINKELIKEQYKKIKDFLIPIIKEQNAKELVACYDKMKKDKKKFVTKNKIVSLRNKPILEYSFVTGVSRNKLKIPLFQILYPKQYKNHLDKKSRERTPINNRLCRNISSSNINNYNISESKALKNSTLKMLSKETIQNNNISSQLNPNLVNTNNIINNSTNTRSNNNNKNNNANNNNNNISVNINDKNTNQNNNIEKKNSIKNNSNINIKRTKTPPLYLRLNEVKQQHDEEIERLRKKYEINYKNNKTENRKNENDNTTSDLNETSSDLITKEKNQKDFKKWYDYEKTWVKMKDMKLNIIKSELEENKICMNLHNKKQETFKPKINKNSDILIANKYNDNFYERLIDYQINKENKAKMLKKRYEPKFKPFVNVNYNINKEYYLYMKYDQKKINNDLNEFINKN